VGVALKSEAAEVSPRVVLEWLGGSVEAEAIVTLSCLARQIPALCRYLAAGCSKASVIDCLFVVEQATANRSW